MDFNRLLDPIRARMRQMIIKGTVLMVDDGGPLQRIQARVLGVTEDRIEHYQPYGFTSRAKSGALGLFLALGGHRAHAIAAVIADPRVRLKSLAEGEVAVYDDLGNVVHLKRTGMLIKAVGENGLRIEADVDVIGTFKVNGVDVGELHKHTNGTTPEGTTGGVIP